MLTIAQYSPPSHSSHHYTPSSTSPIIITTWKMSTHTMATATIEAVSPVKPEAPVHDQENIPM